MLRRTVIDPNKDGARFDFDYYLKTHIPIRKPGFGRVIRGQQGPSHTGWQAAGLFVRCNNKGPSPTDFVARNEKRGGEPMSDVTNYTDVIPTILMEVILTG